MVLYNPDQFDAFEPEPKGAEMVDLNMAELKEAVTNRTRVLVREERLDAERALDKAVKEACSGLRIMPGEIEQIREHVVAVLFDEARSRLEATAEKKRRAHEDEHSHEVFVDTLPPSHPQQPKRDSGYDARERQLPVGDR
ncbi:MAG: hypothetical protein ACYC1K_01305 [Minisyncoccota bacterium]